MIDTEHMRRGWAEFDDMVNETLIRWRAEHPRATLAEIEQAIEEGIRQLRGRYLDDLAAASPTADLATMSVAERPACTKCGGTLQARGKRTRAVVSPGRSGPLRVRRSYAVCKACGNGFFPPR